MTKSLEYVSRILRGPSELERLRYRVEQLQEQVRAERRRATLTEEELAFERQQRVRQLRVMR